VKAAAALGRYGRNLLELKRPGKLLKNANREVRRALRELWAGKSDPRSLWKTVLSNVNTVSGFDMEWKYSVAPMLSDMQAAAKAVARLSALQAKAVKGYRVYGKAQDIRRDAGVTDYDVGGTSSWGPGRFRVQYTKQTKTVAIASVVRKLNPANLMYDVDWFTGLDAVMEINGLNPSAKGIWNLLPLTFITDWFWNAGDLLESLETLSAPIGTSIISSDSLYSVKTETTVTGSGYWTNAQDPTTYSGGATRTTYTRNIDPLTGGPVLYVPPLNLPTQAGQWWSMAQIAMQRIR
jgi:hypothetical protein